MSKLRLIPVLASVLALLLPATLHAQNPPMNCTPDGIIEVCTLADTNSASSTTLTPVLAPEPPAPASPHVTYKDGQLTIVAENVPLSDVLHEVSRKTGAAIEVPAGSATEPVFTNIGPGSVRGVLVKLLNGTKFNYVMLGSQNTADSLQKIVLTPAAQSTEVAESSPPDSPVVAQPAAQRAVTTAKGAAPDSIEQRRANFLATFEAARLAVRDSAREQVMDMLRRRAGGGSGTTASDSPVADSPPAPDSPVPNSPPTDSPAQQ